MKDSPIRLDPATIKLVSFDVFDTVITRKCGPPEAVFRATGGKLRDLGLLTLSPRAFEQARTGAERRARQHRAPREITLAEIYAELNRLWFFPEKSLLEMMNCELQTEHENLYAIPRARSLVAQARRAGKRVVFISDMYLPQEFIREILLELDLMKDGDGIYVSSQRGVSKAGGGLFRVVLEQEKLTGEEVLHLGDSFHSDVRRAGEQGIGARQITHGSLNRFETAMARSEADVSDEAGALAGLARRARLSMDETGARPVASRLGASLAGPLLTAYTEWVLRSALKCRLRRLYFLARDGEALMRLCEVLAPTVGAAGIELKYLHGSREVWGPAVLARMDEGAAAFFAAKIAWSASTWEDCAGHLGFSAQEIAQTALPRKWMPRMARWKEQLFLDVAADPLLGPLLQRRLKEKVSAAARYLREQGLADQVPAGLVDCGWSGSWTDIIGGLAETQGGMKPRVFFIGRRKRPEPEFCETFAWMFDHQTGRGLKTIPDYFHVVVEFLLTANHGRTTGFEEKEGRMHPKLAAVDWQGFEPESWRVYRSAMLNYAAAYAQQMRPGREPADLRAVLNELVVLFWEQPGLEEADFFAGHTIGLSPSRTNTKPLARAYAAGDVLRLALRGKLPGYPPFWWHEGAQALSGQAARICMGTMWETRQFLRALKHGKRPVQSFLDSTRRLKRACERREDHNSCPFETPAAKPGIQREPLAPLMAAHSRQTTTP